MRPAKTDKARDALATRSGGLGAQERHLLILSNGQRSAGELLALLGDSAQGPLQRLLQDGFLRDAAATAGPYTGTVAGALGGDGADVAARNSAPALAAAPRRSLVAAKLYMLDMLQLQRSADAAQLAALLQGSREPDDITVQLAAALGHLRQATPLSYSARIATRLAEIAPLEVWARMHGDAEALADACAA